jgi:chromosome segregation ATPase
MGVKLGNTGDFFSRNEDAPKGDEAGVDSSSEMTPDTTDESEATNLEANELGDASALRIQVGKLTEERGALILDAERKVAMLENIKKERDALKLEVQNVQVQRKDGAALEGRLNFLLQKCEDITEERDALLLGYRRIARERKALLLERITLKDQCKDSTIMQQELNSLKVKSDHIEREKDCYKLRARRLAAKCEGMEKAIEDQKVEAEEIQAKFKYFVPLERELSTLRQQCKNITKERNTFMLRAQRKAESRVAIMIERDALKLEVDNLRTKIKEIHLEENQMCVARMQCQNFKGDGEVFKSEAGWISASRDTMGPDMEALKLEIEGLCARCKTIITLENELNTVKQQCEEMEKERNTFVLAAERAAADMETIKGQNEKLIAEKEKLLKSTKRIPDLQKKLFVTLKALNFVKRSLRNETGELREMTADRNSIREERDALKLKVESLQAKCN